MLNITDKAQQQAITPLFRLAFRCFFWGGALCALVAVPLWMALLHGLIPANWLSVPPLWWHVHELLFGFGLAIVLGFLLTAVQTWTNQTGTQGWRLGLLFGLWVGARLGFWLPNGWLLSLILECCLLGLAAWEFGSRVYRSNNRRNYLFLALLALLALVNGFSYLALSSEELSATQVWQAVTWWFMLLISVMGGRVIPFFTAKRLGFEKAQPLFWLDGLANLPLLGLLVVSLLLPSTSTVAIVLCGVAAVGQMVRAWRWRPLATYSEPLLWSLHLFYWCLPLGLVTWTLALYHGGAYQSSLLHVFTIGCLAGVILAMIARVSLGHTGRNIYQGPNMSLAFIALFVAMLVRSFTLYFEPSALLHSWLLATGLWCLAFAWFLLRYSKALWSARVDGHPG